MPKQVPARWTYKDPFDHERHTPWLRAKAQAKYQGEEWNLSFEDYCYFWTEQAWSLRGRGPTDLVMIRLDTDKGWSVENCRITTRKEQVMRTVEKKARLKQLGE